MASIGPIFERLKALAAEVRLAAAWRFKAPKKLAATYQG